MSNFFPWVKWGNQGLPRHVVGATPTQKGGGARRSSPKRMSAREVGGIFPRVDLKS